MALRQIMLQKKIEVRETELEELRNKDTEFTTREAELETAIDEAGTEEEQRAVEESIATFTAEKDAHDSARSAAESELEELRAEMAELSKKKPINKVERKKDMKRNETEIEELRSGINEYVRSKGQLRDGFTSIEGGALIPEELLSPQEKPDDVVDLRDYVKKVPVNGASGKYPVIAKAGSKMLTVAELEANPKLANPKIVNIDYSVTTRRGYIPISQEVIDDANYDVVDLISREIVDQERNTANTDISAKFKTAKAKTVTGIDGLKDLINKDIKKVYPVKFYISSSLYGEVDKLKDKNGRYLLQDSIAATSGKILLGKEVVVLDDIMIGTAAGDLVGFVGDAKSFCSYFDRKKKSVQWIDNQIYGQLLAGVVRYDVQATDTDAGFYITYNNTIIEG